MIRWTSCLAVLGALVVTACTSAETLLPTPTHHYTFDVDASDSAGTNDGSFVNGASIVADPEQGNVLKLDGENDLVWLEHSNIPPGPTDTAVFTIAAWIKTPGSPTDPRKSYGIYGEFSVGSMVKNFFTIRRPDGEIRFDQFPPSGGSVDVNTYVTDDAWHHVAYVQNEPGSYRRKIYVDGELDGFDNAPEKYSGADPYLFMIGARFGNATDLPYYTQAHIDDLRFYDVALTADQIQAIPEPSTLVLLAMGAVGLSMCARRRRR